MMKCNILTINEKSPNAMFRLLKFGSKHFAGAYRISTLSYSNNPLSTLSAKARCALSFMTFLGLTIKNQNFLNRNNNNKKSLKTGIRKQNRCSSGTRGKAFYLATMMVKSNLTKFLLLYNLTSLGRTGKALSVG